MGFFDSTDLFFSQFQQTMEVILAQKLEKKTKKSVL